MTSVSPPPQKGEPRLTKKRFRSSHSHHRALSFIFSPLSKGAWCNNGIGQDLTLLSLGVRGKNQAGTSHCLGVTVDAPCHPCSVYPPAQLHQPTWRGSSSPSSIISACSRDGIIKFRCAELGLQFVGDLGCLQG